MEPEKPGKPCIFIDADVLFAGAASPNQHSASSLILRMAELTLIEAITSVQVITEVERNLVEKMPKAIPAFRMLVSRSLKVIPDPGIDDLAKAAGLADQEDLPILIAAVQAKCGLLVTFNMRHFLPGHPEVTVLKPGDIVLRIRYLLARLSDRSWEFAWLALRSKQELLAWSKRLVLGPVYIGTIVREGDHMLYGYGLDGHVKHMLDEENAVLGGKRDEGVSVNEINGHLP